MVSERLASGADDRSCVVQLACTDVVDLPSAGLWTLTHVACLISHLSAVPSLACDSEVVASQVSMGLFNKESKGEESEAVDGEVEQSEPLSQGRTGRGLLRRRSKGDRKVCPRAPPYCLFCRARLTLHV